MVGLYDSIAPSGTRRVKAKLANELGLFDMSGNVWEWCADPYTPAYADADNDLRTNTGKYRIIRGGGWVAPIMDLRVSNRWRSEPEIPRNFVGMRPVMEK